MSQVVNLELHDILLILYHLIVMICNSLIYVTGFWKTDQDVTFNITYICLFNYLYAELNQSQITFNYCSNKGNILKVNVQT